MPCEANEKGRRGYGGWIAAPLNGGGDAEDVKLPADCELAKGFTMSSARGGDFLFAP